MDLQGETLETLERLCVRGRERGVRVTSTAVAIPPGRPENGLIEVSVDLSKASQPMNAADSRDVETLVRSDRSVGIRVRYASRTV